MKIIVQEEKKVFFNPSMDNQIFHVKGETLNGRHLDSAYFVRMTDRTDTIQLVSVNEEVEILLDDFLFQNKLVMLLVGVKVDESA